MMNGSNRSITEKITLFILFLLALPFSLIIFFIFIVGWTIIWVFEYPFYKSSQYNKILKAKYYSLITFRKQYRLFNQVVKKGEKQEEVINEKKVMFYQYENIKIYTTNVEVNDDNSYVYLNKEAAEEQFYTENKENKNYIFY